MPEAWTLNNFLKIHYNLYKNYSTINLILVKEKYKKGIYVARFETVWERYMSLVFTCYFRSFLSKTTQWVRTTVLVHRESDTWAVWVWRSNALDYIITCWIKLNSGLKNLTKNVWRDYQLSRWRSLRRKLQVFAFSCRLYPYPAPLPEYASPLIRHVLEH